MHAIFFPTFDGDRAALQGSQAKKNIRLPHSLDPAAQTGRTAFPGKPDGLGL
jgi:hypothetical protein